MDMDWESFEEQLEQKMNHGKPQRRKRYRKDPADNEAKKPRHERPKKSAEERLAEVNALKDRILASLAKQDYHHADQLLTFLRENQAADPHRLAKSLCAIVERLAEAEAEIKLALLEEAVALNPSDSVTLTSYGTALAQAARPEEAFAMFEKALTVNPENSVTLFQYALALELTKAYPKAIEQLLKIGTAKLDPSLVCFMMMTLGRIYYLDGQKEKGNTSFQWAIDHSDEAEATLLFSAKNILVNNPYNPEAVKMLEQITQTSPRYKTAARLLNLNLSEEKRYARYNVVTETELKDTEELADTIYHKMINQIFLLKEDLREWQLDYPAHTALLAGLLTTMERISTVINTTRQENKRAIQAIAPDNYKAFIKLIQATAQNVADAANNLFFQLKSDLQEHLKYDLAQGTPLYQQLTLFLARVRQAEELMNDLKHVNEGIKPKTTTFKIKELFADWEARPTFQQATIRVELRNGEQEFDGDLQKIRSFLDELVENAVKHNAARETLEIQLKAWDDQNPLILSKHIPTNKTYLVLNFRDNGKGIPQAKKEWIFLPLKTTESKEGSGLGLYIIQKTLEKMGGFILENGTTGANFLIYIPYKRAPRTVG